MIRFPALKVLALGPVLFAIVLPACSRPGGNAQTDQHQVPFKEGQSVGDASGSNPTGDKDSGSYGNLSFDDSQSLPAGTLLTVRLKDPIAADNPDFSGEFIATVDEVVAVGGKALLPRGTGASGRVESAHASGPKQNRSYVRLTLDSVNIDGREVPIHTSSLFARGNATQGSAGESPAQVVRLERGRRLTFRLSEPVPIASLFGTPPR